MMDGGSVDGGNGGRVGEGSGTCARQQTVEARGGCDTGIVRAGAPRDEAPTKQPGTVASQGEGCGGGRGESSTGHT